MAEEKLDYTAQFINQIKAKITALQAVLASVESASALGALAQPEEGSGGSSDGHGRGDSFGMPVDLPDTAFNGKSVPACIELYLSSTPMKKRKNKEIATALHEGGVESNASKFDTIVAGALFKLKKDGKVLRFKDGWGLSSWYPPHIRGAADVGSSGKRAKKKGKKNGRKIKPAKSTEGKATDRIIELLRTKPEREYPLADIAAHVGMGVRGTRLALGRLAKAGRVKMSAPGMYAIGRPN